MSFVKEHVVNRSTKTSHPLLFEPSDSRKGLPQSGSLVDVDLASLLRGRLPELLACPVALETRHKDATLAAEILSTSEAECGRQGDLRRVEHMSVLVVRKV